MASPFENRTVGAVYRVIEYPPPPYEQGMTVPLVRS